MYIDGRKSYCQSSKYSLSEGLLTLTVSLPRDCFLKASSPTLSILRQVVKRTKILHSGLNFMVDGRSKLVVSYNVESTQPLYYTTVFIWWFVDMQPTLILSKINGNLCIDETFSWQVIVGKKRLLSSASLFTSLPQLLPSVSDVIA